MIRDAICALLCVSTGLAALCSSAGWADSDRLGIVNVHNTLRSKIAKGTYVAKGVTKPAGKDLTLVAYDCTLESSAQSWANGCPTGHSGAKGKGENIYWSYSTAPISITGQGAAASNSWEGEFQQYGWTNNNLTIANFNTGIGHATQMAWWSSNRVGCGVKQCPSTNSKFPYMIVVVCQYTPQGNILNTNIYNTGASCSGCGSGKTCDTTTKLCQ